MLNFKKKFVLSCMLKLEDDKNHLSSKIQDLSSGTCVNAVHQSESSEPIINTNDHHAMNSLISEFSCIRNVERREIKVRNNEEEDKDDMSNLTVRKIKDAFLTCYLPRSGDKSNLIARVVAHL